MVTILSNLRWTIIAFLLRNSLSAGKMQILRQIPISCRYIVIVLAISLDLPVAMAQSECFNYTYHFNQDPSSIDLGGMAVPGPKNSYLVFGIQRKNERESPERDRGLSIYKFNADGELVLNKVYRYLNHNFYFRTPQKVSGNRILVASGLEDSIGTENGYLACFNTEGDTLWTKQYSRSNESGLYCIAETPDKGFIIGGWINKNRVADFYLLKIDSLGNEQWWTSFGSEETDVVTGILPHPEGGYLVGGTTFNQSVLGSNHYFCRVDTNGVLLWEITRFGSIPGDQFDLQENIQGMLGSMDGKVIIYGDKNLGMKHGGIRAYLAKMDWNGDLIWETTIGGAGFGYNRIKKAIQLPDSSFAAVGYITNTAQEPLRAILARFGKNGDSLWMQRDTTSIHRDLNSIIYNPWEKGFFLSGDVYTDGGFAGKAIWIMRVDSIGNFESCEVENPPRPPVLVQPSLEMTGANPLTNESQLEIFIPDGFWPTYFELFDITGTRHIKRILGPGNHVIDLPAMQMRPGLYIARMRDSKQKETILKLIKMQ